MNSFYSYYKLIIIISLLFSQITQPMQSNSLSTQDKVIICMIIPAFFATAYGFYKFLDGLHPKQTNLGKTTSSNQIIGNVITAKNIDLQQDGSPDTENPSWGILSSKYFVTEVLPAPEGAVIMISFCECSVIKNIWAAKYANQLFLQLTKRIVLLEMTP